MHELILSGIPGSNPIGAMASFGLFRIVVCERPFGDARLSWRRDTDWRPVLHTAENADAEVIAKFLVNRQPERTKAAFLLWNDDIKCDPPKYRCQLEKARHEFLSAGRESIARAEESARFFCAFGGDGITAKSTADIKPTAFHMTAGQQRFLKSALELSVSLDPQRRSSKRQTEEQRHAELVETWREAICGTWKYSDSHHSLGWDPTTEGLYALSDRSPSAAGASSVRTAVWLAFESLPLFPCVPGERKLLTTGFDQHDESFLWPVWESPITLDSVRALIGSPEITASKLNMAALRRRGIAALFRARCIRDGNGRGTFRNAVEFV